MKHKLFTVKLGRKFASPTNPMRPRLPFHSNAQPEPAMTADEEYPCHEPEPATPVTKLIKLMIGINPIVHRDDILYNHIAQSIRHQQTSMDLTYATPGNDNLATVQRWFNCSDDRMLEQREVISSNNFH